MKPWITEAIGTQKVAAPSSVDQPDFATSEKFAIAARSLRSASVITAVPPFTFVSALATIVPTSTGISTSSWPAISRWR